MQLRLSHFGWRVARHLADTDQLHLGVDPQSDLLLDLWTGMLSPSSGSQAEQQLLAEGLIELVDNSITLEQTTRRYRRNPFEHLTRIIFEFTTCCNFSCDHCYNAPIQRWTESRPELLFQAAETFFKMGLRRFDFVGGEVSRYGNGWLELARQIRALGDDLLISVYTNGWWLEQSHFQAAGKEYADTWEYLADLKMNGVTHVVFSLDGPGELHDASRHQPGLYRRIMSGLAQVRLAGLEPRVSLLIRPEWSDAQVMQFLAEPATIIYRLDPLTPADKRALRLSLDETNSLSHFIDIGNGAGDATVQNSILDHREHALYCRNFYRLSPALTIKANGELATCRLASAGEGYGNLHEQRLVDILNHFDEAFVYQLHASRRLEEYLPLVDRTLFGEAFTHLCTLRSIVTLLARKLQEQGVASSDQAAVRRINREVAGLTGHLTAL